MTNENVQKIIDFGLSCDNVNEFDYFIKRNNFTDEEIAKAAIILEQALIEVEMGN